MYVCYVFRVPILHSSKKIWWILSLTKHDTSYSYYFESLRLKINTPKLSFCGHPPKYCEIGVTLKEEIRTSTSRTNIKSDFSQGTIKGVPTKLKGHFLLLLASLEFNILLIRAS